MENNQPFQIGDKVMISTSLPKEVGEQFIGKQMIVIEIRWIGFGDEDNPYGCESGWEVTAALRKTMHVNKPNVMEGYDSHWFVKWEK